MIHSALHPRRLARDLATHLVDRHATGALAFAEDRLSRVRGTPRERFARNVVEYVEDLLGETRTEIVVPGIGRPDVPSGIRMGHPDSASSLRGM